MSRSQDRPRLAAASPYVFAAVVCYLPMLLTKPGVVSDDTKTYLYYDPGRWTKTAASIWDPEVALGTVTHQTVGYLFPMGPFFWFFSLVHVPVWVAQRLWLGSILFVAAAGVLYLCKVHEVRGLGALVAALTYGFTPYVMQYAGRISVILLPYSGLPWMMALIALAVRHKGWRYPALFALVVGAVSGINASSVAYVAVGPLLWLCYSAFCLRELRAREACGVLLRTGLLTVLACLWWFVGLSIEGLYGVDILKYTESVQATSSTSAASEVIRGLGYWYFYGGDRLGLWTAAVEELISKIPLLALTYFVPVAAFCSAAFVRWRHRAFFVILVAAGVALSVGAHPFSSPTPFGLLAKAFMTKTTIGLSLRSTDRATPLVVLGLAMLLGTGVTAVVARFGRDGVIAGAVAGVLVLGANAPLFAGRTVISQFTQPASPPSYVEAAARYLNSIDKGTRVYALPGDDFAAYTYGDTIDPIWAAVLKRPFVTHEQQIMGSMATANLLYAIDNPLQQGTMDWRALAPIARLMSVGSIVVEYDEQYARYDSPRPALLEHDLAVTPPGLSHKVGFGTPRVNVSSLPMLDETYYDLPPASKATNPVVVYQVSDPRPIVRGESLSDPIIMAGDNVGVVEAADDGLLADNPTIVFAGTLDEHPALAKALLGHGADLVLTDSNRKEAYEWNSLSENTGYTETASERPTPFEADDPGFDLFPHAPVTSYTTAINEGIKSVTASAYGTALTLRSEFQPANAIDGSLSTSWETEGTSSSGVVGQWWQVTLRHPVTAGSVRLTQPLTERDATWLTNQYLTKVTLTFDGKDPVTVSLGPSSRTSAGQVVRFAPRHFATLRIRIDATNYSHYKFEPVGASLVGLANVSIAYAKDTQVIALPSDLLDEIGKASLKDRLSILLEREAVAPVPPRSQPEPYMVREWKLPTARSFSLTGEAHLSSYASDGVIDKDVGRGSAGRGDPLVSATSSSRMPGDLWATASSTLEDGDHVWMPGLGTGANVDSYLQYRFKRPLTVDQLTMRVSSDREHSVPTRVVVSAGGASRTVLLPAIPVTPKAGSVTTVHIHFKPVTGKVLRLEFPTFALRYTVSYETSQKTALPIGISGVSIPGTARVTLPAKIPASCRSDLLSIDGKPVWLRITGSASSALGGGPLDISLCGRDKNGIRLGAGSHLLVAANGASTGFDLDELALDSAPGGAAAAAPPTGDTLAPAPSASSGAPKVTVLSSSSTSYRLRVSGATKPFMLTLGESYDAGWTASVQGGPALGAPVLVDGFANGWRVTARTLAEMKKEGGSFVVTVRFAPQSELDWALAVSAATALGCIGIAVVPLFWRRRRCRRRGLPAAGDGATVAGALDATTPVIVSPFTGAAPGRQLGVAVLTTVVAGLLALLFAGPTVAIVVAAAAWLSMRTRAGRAALALAALAAMVVAAAMVVVIQIVDRWPAGSGWPSYFNLPSTVVWVAVTLMAADAGIEIARRRRHRGTDPAPGQEIPGASEHPE